MRTTTLLLGLLAVAALPRTAAAQTTPSTELPPPTSSAIGEKYHIEVAGSLWNPTVAGTVSSDQFGIAGTQIDFVNDLGFQQTRFRDFRISASPATRHKFTAEYTPIMYTATSRLNRNVTFDGILYPVAVPVASQFDWKVWRFDYEYDFVHRSRGFVGFELEGRYTQFDATLKSVLSDEFTSAKGVLPAIGIVGSGYVLPNVAIDFNMSGFKIPNIRNKYAANYYDWNIKGTVNVTRYFGVEVGWRRVTTYLDLNQDVGNTKFQGLWYGGVIRY